MIDPFDLTGERSAVIVDTFRRRVWRHYETFGRHDMPWRKTRDPYRILVSEIMLQQTQVSRVVMKYGEFLQRFPDLGSLARASQRDVVSAWTGLGYNRRARYLHQTAKRIVDDHGSQIPSDPAMLKTFPGIGVNTAGSISCFAYDTAVVFIETNIRRALIYSFFSEKPDPETVEPAFFSERFVAESTEGAWFEPRKTSGIIDDSTLLPLIEMTLDQERPREWYYALMDYGNALVRYVANPNRASRQYVRQSTFEGSRRQVRGRVIRVLSDLPCASENDLLDTTGAPVVRLQSVLQDLLDEGLIVQDGPSWRLAE